MADLEQTADEVSACPRWLFDELVRMRVALEQISARLREGDR